MDLKNLTPEQKALLAIAETQAVEKGIGITVSRALEFLAQSRSENDGQEARADAIGKFKHFLRVKHGWGGFVDAAWPHIEKFAAAAVDAALAFEAAHGAQD